VTVAATTSKDHGKVYTGLDPAVERFKGPEQDNRLGASPAVV
jgi:hypothetical protein